MKASQIYTLFILAAVVAIAAYSIRSMGVSDNYAPKIEKERREKNETFKNSDESPLTDMQKSRFDSLSYFPVNQQFKIKAKFVRNENREEKVVLTYTDDTQKSYLKYGFAEFEVDGIPQRVAILKPDFAVAKNYLFLPFYDETSALETYGGGRYLEPEKESGGYIILDFNKAYNPYCAYNEEYRCPIPPRENQITGAIKAGEKTFELKILEFQR